jgi:myo-inositol-1(or 4)-monophosphatase
MILEAGGLITDLAGEAGFMESGNVVAGTPKVFGQLLQTVQAHR